MKIKKKLKKFGKGGQNSPIITHDKNDPRISAYQDSLDLYNFYELQKDLDRASDVNTNLSFMEKLFGGQRQFLPEGQRRQTELYNKAQDYLIKNPNLKTGLHSLPISTKEQYKEKGSYDLYSPNIKPRGEWMGSGKNSDYSNVKPVQPIIYEPEDTRVPQNNNGVMNVLESNKTPWGQRITEIPKGKKESDYQIKNYSYNGNGMWTYVPKEQPIKIQSSRPDLLQGNNQQLEFNPIPFKKGTYFTRPRQRQEEGYGELVDYFDKKTGKPLGTYEDGGNIQTYAMGGINRYDVPAQMPTGQQFFQLPYNELATALLSKQKQQDDLTDQLNKTSDVLSSLKEGYDTKGLANEVRNSYNDIINQMSSGELDKNKINNLGRMIRNDSRIGLLAKSAKEAELYDKYRQTHKDFNLWVQPQLDVQGNWKQAKDEQGNWLNSSDYQGYINNLTPYNYYLAEVDDAGKNLKANIEKQFGADASIWTDKEGNTWLKKHGEKGVTKIDESLPQYKAALNSVLDSWLKKSTPGSQYLDAYYKQQGHSFDEETAKRIINDRLKTFTFSQENRNESVDLVKTAGQEEEPMELTPYGETPSQDNPKLFDDLNFLKFHKKGENVEQTSPIYTSSSGVPLTTPETRFKDGYDQFKYNDLSQKQYNTIVNSTRNLVNAGKLEKSILDKVLSKKPLSDEEQKKLYPQLEKSLDRLTKNEGINSQYEGLSTSHADAITTYYFGNKEIKAKDLSTGNSGNVTLYDPETGNKLRLKDLSKELKDSDEPIKITTQLRGNNTYNYMFGENDDLINPYQVFIGGKMYLVPAPKGFSGKGSETLNKKRDLDSVTNKFTNSYISAAPVTLSQDYDAVYDEQDNSYKIYYKGEPLKIQLEGKTLENYNSPQEAALVFYSYMQTKKKD